MSYSEFKTITKVQEKFSLMVKESENLFVDIQPVTICNKPSNVISPLPMPSIPKKLDQNY
ncbi:hypothetical protein [Pseudanabaena sp. SR411]|uniref:hypothetical protein n=1 Tax=Pseudanabaena sp. SR411 TaxID=1980935 RepID=UPI001C3C80B9|nr:hypothetical protein [Pseudanabaena sp. SR411]